MYPTMFDIDGRPRGHQWVLDGEGTAYPLYDGLWCEVREDGLLYDFSGEPMDSKVARQALRKLGPKREAGLYWLIGRYVNGNPHRYPTHLLVPHDSSPLLHDFREYHRIVRHLKTSPALFGILWIHPDGSKVQCSKRDLHLRWPG
jgi:hypothetical protein